MRRTPTWEQIHDLGKRLRGSLPPHGRGHWVLSLSDAELSTLKALVANEEARLEAEEQPALGLAR